MNDALVSGAFVEWPEGKGRIDLLVSSGAVPGVDGDVEATAPMARVALWEDGKATGVKVAVATEALKRIVPLDGTGEKSDPAAALVALHGEHESHREETGLAESASLTGLAVKSAYDRGLADWPGSDQTALSPIDWALGRAAHLCKAALGEVEDTNDVDLLHHTHPLAMKHAEATGTAVIDAEQVQAEVDAIMSAADVSD